MKNITITLEEKTAAWIRVLAAQQGKSVSRLVGEVLHERMRESRDYTEAMQRFLDRKPFRFHFVEGTHTARDDLHDRPGLR